LFYPYAVFPFTNGLICSDDPRFSYRPEREDQIILLSSQQPKGRGRKIFTVEPEELFVAKADGSLVIPQSLMGQVIPDDTVKQIEGLVMALGLSKLEREK
jgi:hypothetical protein